LEEVEGVIEKERRKAMEMLDRALKDALDEVQKERERAMQEETALREESDMELARIKSSILSEQDIESRRLISRSEDDLQERLINEALEDLLHDPGYEKVLDTLFQKAYKSIGKGASVLYGKDDEEAVKRLAEKYDVKVKGEAQFSRGFALEKGSMMATYSVYDMVNEIKRNLKREIRKEVGYNAG
jgi:vacuolar-type H+-ATPase subunit E/Vma4